jgi:hypothetical protein
VELQIFCSLTNQNNRSIHLCALLALISSHHILLFHLLLLMHLISPIPFADVYEEVLEIVSYMTFFSPTISPDMWTLWPLMMEALNDWAIDFFESTITFMLWHYILFYSLRKNIFLHHCCVPILIADHILRTVFKLVHMLSTTRYMHLIHPR